MGRSSWKEMGGGGGGGGGGERGEYKYSKTSVIQTLII